jgi:hypothetical protein
MNGWMDEWMKEKHTMRINRQTDGQVVRPIAGRKFAFRD